MGQAKRRGTFEERLAQALATKDAERILCQAENERRAAIPLKPNKARPRMQSMVVMAALLAAGLPLRKD